MRPIFTVLLLTLGLTILTGNELAEPGQRGQRGQRGGAGAQTPTQRRLAWVDRTGKVLGTIGSTMNSILDPSISPDGTKVIFRGRQEAGETDHLWIAEGNRVRRLTTNEGAERHMVFSPAGDRIAYSIQNAGQGNVSNLYIRAADGSGADQPLVVSEGMHKWYPTWSPDARTVVFHTNDTTTQSRDLWFVNVANGQTGVLVDSPAIEALARMSPNGRFVAYQSDEGGTTEIWVTTFPRSSSKWKVSTNGGTWAKWGNNELFFWQGNQLMVAKVNTEDTFSAETPQKLFTGVEAGMGAAEMTSYNPEYDVSADGSRIVVSQRLQ